MSNREVGPVELQENDIVQIVPEHKWGGCLAVVDEVKNYGCRASVSIPKNNGTPPGSAYINLEWKDFESVGAQALFVPALSKQEG